MKKRIVIAGFGDTGLLTAINLSEQFEIIAISTKPCLVSGQELGTRLTQPETWKQNYLIPFNSYKKLRHVKIHHGRVTAFDLNNNLVSVQLFNGGEIVEHYDVLLIACGVSNGFWRNNKLESLNIINRQLEENLSRIQKAQRIAIIGGGASAASVSSNIKENFPEKEVHLFYPKQHLLNEYPPETRRTIQKKLTQQDIMLHPEHRAIIPKELSDSAFTNESIQWQNKVNSFQADLCIWTIGKIKPNNEALPKSILNEQGFVKTDQFLRVENYNNVFAVGDIAASDPQRCSARNNGFVIAAHNISSYLTTQKKMKAFKPSQYRWGSILGIQKEGMRVFTPKGNNILIRPWFVKNLLFPIAVRKMIYKGITKTSPIADQRYP